MDPSEMLRAFIASLTPAQRKLYTALVAARVQRLQDSFRTAGDCTTLIYSELDWALASQHLLERSPK